MGGGNIAALPITCVKTLSTHGDPVSRHRNLIFADRSASLANAAQVAFGRLIMDSGLIRAIRLLEVDVVESMLAEGMSIAAARNARS